MEAMLGDCKMKETQCKNKLSEKIDYGVRRGVARALAQHKKAGRSVVVSVNGKVTYIPPEEIKIPKEFENEL